MTTATLERKVTQIKTKKPKPAKSIRPYFIPTGEETFRRIKVVDETRDTITTSVIYERLDSQGNVINSHVYGNDSSIRRYVPKNQVYTFLIK